MAVNNSKKKKTKNEEKVIRPDSLGYLGFCMVKTGQLEALEVEKGFVFNA
jgi:hypothetical protein